MASTSSTDRCQLVLMPSASSRGKAQMQVRQDLVHGPQEGPAGQETDHRRHPGRAALRFGHLDGRRQQGPEAGRDHDPGRETQHGVQQLAVDGLEEEDERGAQGGHAPGEQGGQQGLLDRMQFDEPDGHRYLS